LAASFQAAAQTLDFRPNHLASEDPRINGAAPLLIKRLVKRIKRLSTSFCAPFVAGCLGSAEKKPKLGIDIDFGSECQSRGIDYDHQIIERL